MIPIADEQLVLSRVVDALLHETFSTSYAVIVPPCFGEDAVGDALVERLQHSDRRPLVASITIDHVATSLGYVQELHRQWSRVVSLGPEPRRGTSSTVALTNMLGAVPSGRPVVQVVRRFGKFLDVLDTQMLGAMRSLESSDKLRSVICSPFTYGDLKRRWAERGKKLLVSDYGDAHRTEIVRPLAKHDALLACAKHGIPNHVAQFIVEQTGGYPELCFGMIGEWTRQYASKGWSNAVKREFAELACQRLERFVEHLDVPGQHEYRTAILDLHYGMATERALTTLDRHPWKESILEDGELRAEAIGPAVVATLRGTQAAAFPLARELYANGQYRQARDMIEPGTTTLPEQLLFLQAQAMTLLVDPDDGLAGLDTDWKRLRRILAEASDLLASSATGMSVESLTRVRVRYGELTSAADAIANAAKGGRRVVDTLARVAPREAFWLLQLEHKRARAYVRHSAATLAALALPEQIFRMWAQWTLDLDQYQQPADGEAVWAEVQRRWHSGEVSSSPGKLFPSFDAFAWFALVAAERANVPVPARPESTWEGLTQSLSLLQIRRDQAHSLARCTQDDRRKLFDLIERWMTALLPSCRAHAEPWAIDEFEYLTRPLPLLRDDGELEWL